MDLGLKGKRALTLASSQGLGFAVASALCSEGANVLISGRSADKLAAVTRQLNESGGGQASYVEVDLSDRDAADRLYEKAQEQLGGIDILLNNTGGPPPGPVHEPSTQSWQAHFEIMVFRLMEITNLCLPEMKAAGWGRILTISSSGVLQPLPNMAMSNTIRASLVGWNKTLSNEMAPHGITANILAPGRIHTQRVDQLDAAAAKRLGKTVEEVREGSRAKIPVGRYGRVEEFGAVGAFLLSEPASYITGSVIRCDGGAVMGI